MKIPKKAPIQIFLFIIYSIFFSFFLVLLSRLSVAIIFAFIRGYFYFPLSSITYSAKAGIAVGIPLGFGSWVLCEIDDRK